MMQKPIAATLIGAMLLVLPGSSKVVTAAETQYLRVATLAPRDSDLAKTFVKLDKSLKDATKGAWGVRLYPGGVAGDEVDVIRKIKIGQMDASSITSVGLSQIVRDTAVLTTPGVISSYKQLEAVQAVMNKEWEASFEKVGFNVIAWGETGQLRWFAKNPLPRPSAIKTMRPWVWPISHTTKEVFHSVGASGVPLGVPEVYGALQTGMADMVISTCVALVSLQWHTNLKFMTKNTFGVLVGALLVGSEKWKAMPPDVAQLVQTTIIKNRTEDRADMRKADDRAYENLLKRGYTANEWTGDALAEYDALAVTVQKKLTGRLYSAETLDRVKKIVAANK
jgi:TRAP-type C4-dicarboxylate transport system substrate-binding protein